MPLVSAHYSESCFSVSKLKAEAFIFQIQNRTTQLQTLRNKSTETKREKKRHVSNTPFISKDFSRPHPAVQLTGGFTVAVKTWSSCRPYSAPSLRLCLWKRSQVWEPLLIFVIWNSSSDFTHMHTNKQALWMSSIHMQKSHPSCHQVIVC